MRFFGRQGWGLALLLTTAVVIVAVIPKIVQAATICNACKGTGKVLEMCTPCTYRWKQFRNDNRCPGCYDMVHTGGCPYCHGKGVVCPQSCSYCGGTGEILSPAEKEAMRKIQLEKEAQWKARKSQEERAKAEAERARVEAERAERDMLEKISSYFTDSRDRRKYRIVTIGGKTWMAENLNYVSVNSWCYGDDDSNCEKYGKLYNWWAANTVCPAGYHLPSRLEWDNLAAAVGGKNVAGKKLRAISSDGTNDFGFSALLGGFRSAKGPFADVRVRGDWWTSKDFSDDKAYSRYIYGGSVDEDYYNKENGFSVRCVQDN
jgi:uncharacterized protein (TIGR02145 family)